MSQASRGRWPPPTVAQSVRDNTQHHGMPDRNEDGKWAEDGCWIAVPQALLALTGAAMTGRAMTSKATTNKATGEPGAATGRWPATSKKAGVYGKG